MSTPRPCASSDERDMQDTSPEEPHREQDTPVRSPETPNPTRPGGTPLGRAAAMCYSSWCGRSMHACAVSRTVCTGARTWRCHLRAGHGTTRSTARHAHEGGVVPRISTRRAIWPGPYFGPCLGRHGTKIARRHFYNYKMQFSSIYYTISRLILK
jgi:hypothetical protein